MLFVTVILFLTVTVSAAERKCHKCDDYCCPLPGDPDDHTVCSSGNGEPGCMSKIVFAGIIIGVIGTLLLIGICIGVCCCYMKKQYCWASTDLDQQRILGLPDVYSIGFDVNQVLNDGSSNVASTYSHGGPAPGTSAAPEIPQINSAILRNQHKLNSKPSVASKYSHGGAAVAAVRMHKPNSGAYNPCHVTKIPCSF